MLVDIKFKRYNNKIILNWDNKGVAVKKMMIYGYFYF